MDLLKILPVVLAACAVAIIIYETVASNEGVRSAGIKSAMFVITAIVGGLITLQWPSFTSLQSNVNAIQNNIDQLQNGANETQRSINQLQVTVNQYLENQPDSTPTPIPIGLNGLPIGTIIASMLPPERFRSESEAANLASVWVPADGRKVQGTPYEDAIGPSVPDLRGVFIRGLNIFDPRQPHAAMSQLDPDYPPVDSIRAARSAGEFEKDTFGEHSHPLGNRKRWEASATSRNGETILDFERFTPRDGLSTTSRGDSKETRPKNVAVYYYIKVK